MLQVLRQPLNHAPTRQTVNPLQPVLNTFYEPVEHLLRISLEKMRSVLVYKDSYTDRIRNSMIEITAESVRRIPKNGLTDPIEFYRKPLVGWLFRERINLGLRLLGEKHFRRGLEVGYGAGALLLHLAPIVSELHGLDLDADPIPVARMLDARGLRVHLRRGSVLEMPYPSNHFDMIACFSVMEHLHSYRLALSEMARVLAPNGVLLLGMPAVSKWMEAGFRAIGFKGIEEHHVTTPSEVSSQFAMAGFTIMQRNNLVFPLRREPGFTLYYNWLLRKRETA